MVLVTLMNFTPTLLMLTLGPSATGVTFAGQVDSPDDGALFKDVSPRALPAVTTRCGSLAKDYIVEVNGGGLGLADFDLDGDLDLLVVDGSTVERLRSGSPGFAPRLFLNDGQGQFTATGEAWSLAPGSWGTGCAIGDVDGDGDPDLIVLDVGDDRLFINRKGTGFGPARTLLGNRDEASPDSAQGTPDPASFAALSTWSTSATFLDYDGDGVLDLFVTRYLIPDLSQDAAHAASWKGHPVMRGPQGLPPVADQLLRGLGGGRFEDVSQASGIAATDAAYGLGVITLDQDGDGDTDLFVSNDSAANHLWRNRGDGTFAEVGLQVGVAYDCEGRAQASMGIAAGDLDGDGHQELFVTNFSSESNTLYSPRRRGVFRDRSARSGLVAPGLHRLGWGTGMQDVDLDGDMDLWVLNGHVYPEADHAGTDTSYAQGDQVLLQGAGGRFLPHALCGAAKPIGESEAPERVSRAGVQGDLDGDGDLDLVVLTLDGPVRVLLNQARPANRVRWLGVRLHAPEGNTAGLGARITLRHGDTSITREVRGSGGFQAAAPAAVHFTWQVPAPGNSAVNVAPLELHVLWPGGQEQSVPLELTERWMTVERARATTEDDRR